MLLVINQELAQGILNYLSGRPHLFVEIRPLIEGLERMETLDVFLKKKKEEAAQKAKLSSVPPPREDV